MKVRQFFRIWWLMLTSTHIYERALKMKTSGLVVFFLLSSVLLSLLAVYHFHSYVRPLLLSDADQSFSELQQHYPNNLVLDWDGTTFHSSSPQPVTLDYPSVFNPSDHSLPSTLAFIVPQDQTTDTLTQAVPTPSLLLITPHQVWVNNQTSWQSAKITDLLDPQTPFTINQTNLPAFITTTKEYLNMALDLWSILIVPQFILTLLLAASFEALVLFCLNKVAHWRLTYGQLWKFSLMVSLVASLIDQVSVLISPTYHLPMFVLSFWAIVATVFVSQRRTVTH